jgi:hypothetical protein
VRGWSRRLRWPVGATREPHSAQALVEFGLVLPLFLAVMMVAVQFSVLLFAQLSVAWVAHNMVRYVATGNPENWRFPDSCHTNHRNAILPAILQPGNFATFAYSPPYQPATANCSNQAMNSPQPEAVTPPRIRGGALALRVQYQPRNLVFLPTSFFGVPVLRTLPPYEAAAVME